MELVRPLGHQTMGHASLFQPVRPRRLYEAIVGQIRDLIADRHLQPGDRLPSERELAEVLNVSRASVRPSSALSHICLAHCQLARTGSL